MSSLSCSPTPTQSHRRSCSRPVSQSASASRFSSSSPIGRRRLAFTGLREVRANLDDVEAITLGLSAFLGLGQVGRAGPEATLRRRTPQPELGQWLDVKLRELQTVTSPTSQGHQLEQIVAELFRESGAEVQVAERGPDRGIDMAVMFGSDEPFGGVLFVQVERTRRATSTRFRNAMAQLQAAVIDRGTQLGLLVYSESDRNLPLVRDCAARRRTRPD